MQLIDTHCHLDFIAFDLNRTEIIKAANDVGVSKILVPGVIAKNFSRLQVIVNKYACLYPALGLHPYFVEQHSPDDLAYLEQQLSLNKPCALGEIGLDLWIDEPNYELQLFYLQAQLKLANKFNLPVLLHVRKAHDLMLQQIRRIGCFQGGIVHAFSGSQQQAMRYLELGFKLGIGGTISYTRAKKLRRLVANLPLKSFVLETDSPDMPLANYRAEINQPKRIIEIAKYIAAIRCCTVEEVAEVTSYQAKNMLFNT